MKKIILLCLFGLLFQNLDAQSSVNLRLTTDGNEIDTIQRGEVLQLDIELSNPMARTTASWNAAALNHLEDLNEKLKQQKITREEFDKRKSEIESQLKEVAVVTIGSEKEPWTRSINWRVVKSGDRSPINWPIKYLNNPGTEDIAILNESAYYIASYGIDPDRISQIPPGSYEVTALLGDLRSTTVIINIDGASFPLREQNSTNHYLKLGNFYWQSGDAVKAQEYADKILTREPASISALVLKANALKLQQSWAAALEIYKKALIEYYNKAGKNAEPPEYIIDMIEIVKAKQ